jgi:hypothetical protein
MACLRTDRQGRGEERLNIPYWRNTRKPAFWLNWLGYNCTVRIGRRRQQRGGVGQEALRRPSGAVPPSWRTPFSFFSPRFPQRGTGGGINGKRGVAASAQSNPASFAPHLQHGAKLNRNQQRRGEAATTRPRIGDCHERAWMHGRGNRPWPFLASGIGAVPERAVAVTGDRAFSERRKARPATRGMPEKAFRGKNRPGNGLGATERRLD